MHIYFSVNVCAIFQRIVNKAIYVDKDIYMNKLDTHLTNLKNKIRQGLLKEIKFLTKNNNLYLVSN